MQLVTIKIITYKIKIHTNGNKKWKKIIMEIRKYLKVNKIEIIKY